MKIGKYINFLRTEAKIENSVLLNEVFKKISLHDFKREKELEGQFTNNYLNKKNPYFISYSQLIKFQSDELNLNHFIISILLNYFNKTFRDALLHITICPPETEYSFENWNNINKDTKALILCSILYSEFNSHHINNIKDDYDLMYNIPKQTLNYIHTIKSINFKSNSKNDLNFEFNKLASLIFLENLRLEHCTVISFAPLVSLTKLNLSSVSVKNRDSLKLLLNLEEIEIIKSNIPFLTILTSLNKLSKISIDYFSEYDFEGEFLLNKKEYNKTREIIEHHQLKELKYISGGTFNFRLLEHLRNVNYVSINGRFSDYINTELFNIKILEIKENFGNSRKIGENITQFINLECLNINIRKSTINFQEIPTSLILLNCKLSSFNFEIFSHCINLKSIIIEAKYFFKIDSLNNLSKLEVLELGPSKLDTFEEFFKQHSSQYIISFKDTKFLNNFKQIKRLKLIGQHLKKIEEIECMPNLEYLDLSYNEISDIEFIKHNKEIKYLNLSFNKITDISPLFELTKLQNVILNNNFISNISSLKNLQFLNELNLNNNQIKDITSLNKLKNIINLHLDFNYIEDLNPIKELTLIENLHLNNNKIKNIESLEKFIKLKYLSLNNNIINSIHPLIHLISLENIYLINNKISNLTCLKFLDNLEIVNITGNFIKLNFSELSSLNKYLTIIIDFNYIDEKYYNSHSDDFPNILFHKNSTKKKKEIEYDDDEFENDNEDGPYCSSCDCSPCMCSDPENTSSTWG